ncbi:MAG: ATP-binding protein [Desulfurivibrionaceae bacterium]
MLPELLQYPLYLFYGLAFFSIGAAIVSKNLKFSKLSIADTLIWLALFAFAHAANEWLVLFLIIYAPILPDDLAALLDLLKISLLAVSFIFLFWFGMKVAALNRFRWLKYLVLGGAWSLSSAVWWQLNFVPDFKTLLRLYLCFPAGVKICVGFILYAKQVRSLSPKGARNLAAAGVAILAYAILAGLVPSRMIVFGEFIPVELLRMIAGFVFLHFLMNALHIFDAEQLDIIEERLNRFAQSEKMTSVGRLAAGIAHEINTPLSNVLLNVERLEKELETNPPQESRVRLASIRRNIDRAAKIAKELLFFSRSQPIEFIPVDLNRIIRQSIELIGPNLRDFPVNLDLGNVPPIAGIPWKLEEIMVNLLINAMDASQPGSPITITTAVSDTGIVCTIRDQGGGVPAGDKKNIFDPFFTTKEPGKGTGLGLSICYSIMTLHGGEIEIESPPGQGTIARLIFPLKARTFREERP